MAFVLELDDRRDARMPGQAFDERIFDRHAERLREREELRVVERLLAKKNHAMLEPRLANFPDGIRRERLHEIDAVDFGADGGGEFFHFHGGAVAAEF